MKDMQRFFWLGATHYAEEMRIVEGKLVIIVSKDDWIKLRKYGDDRDYFFDPSLMDQSLVNFRAVFRIQPYFIAFWGTEEDKINALKPDRTL